jgi:hypothetical protein
MKQTQEFINALFNTISQGVESFKDGFQINDITDFVDEGMSWPNAVNGLAEGFPEEAKTATVEEVDAMFKAQESKLVKAGVNPMLVGAIISNMKGIYYVYAVLAQKGEIIVK